MNIDAYFSRIGYTGPREPSFAVLRDIVLAHSCTIPFENLDVLLGRGISLNIGDIERKLVHARRGGYCFEQNTLLLTVLQELGYSVTPLSARVRYRQPADYIPARTHLFLRVTLENVPWLVDVGIGGFAPTAPLRLDQIATKQATPHERFRITRVEMQPFARYYEQAQLGESWQDVLEFTLEEMPQIDRELANWWTSAHPQSRFRQNLLLAVARPNGERVTIFNEEFTHRRGAEILQQVTIHDPQQLLDLLKRHFQLDFPPGTVFGSVNAPWYAKKTLSS